MTSGGTNESQQFATWVRNFIHYDNLASNYSKQASGARKLKDDFESRIINNLRQNNMQNAIIQVTGANLQYAEERSPPTLSMPRLETYLHKYYLAKGNSVDETDAILRFIKHQKTLETVSIARLKKNVLPTPIPPPPGSGPPGQTPRPK